MSAFAYVAEHLTSLLVGITLLLGAGMAAVLLVREPAHRQRIGELSVLAAMLLIAFSLIPLPRPGKALFGALMNRQVVAAEEPRVGRTERKESARSQDGPTSRVLVPAQPAPIRIELELPSATASPMVKRATQTPARPPVPHPESRPDFSLLLLGVWFAGASLLAAWILLGAVRLARLLRRARPAPDRVMAAAQGFSSGMRRAPRIVVIKSSRLAPFCLMLPRPTIVLPDWLTDRDREGDLGKVLRHEFVHLRRGDGLGRNLFALALPLFWFHPLFWWLRSRVRLAAELIADDEVGRSGDHTEYARQLVRLAERDAGFVPSPLGSVGVLGSKSEFYRRIEMLMKNKSRLAVRCNRPARIALCCGAALSVLLASSLLGAEPKAQDKGALKQEIQQLQEQNHQLRAELEGMSRRLKEMEVARAPRPGFFGEPPGPDAPFGEVPGPDMPFGRPPGPDALFGQYFEVEVKQGDTLPRIWSEYFAGEVDTHRWQRLNPGVDPRRLEVGQVIRLPDAPPELDPDFPGDPLLPAPAPEMRPEPSSTRSVVSLELLDVVTRMIDLESEIQIAELEVSQAEAAHEASVMSDGDLRSRKIVLASLARKHQLLRRVAVAELEVARVGLQNVDARVTRSQILHEKGLITEGELHQDRVQRTVLEARVQLLESVL